MQDFATDAIVPLFIKDKNGELPLKKALLNWNNSIVDEASAYYFFSKIIENRLDQEIAKKLKEADPFFGKILRSFNHLVESKKINKRDWFGIIYLVEKNCFEIKQKPIEPEFLENLPSELFQGTTKKIVCKLLDYIKKETDYFPALPLNSLIRKIKHVNGSFLKASFPEVISERFEENLDINGVVNNSLKAVNNKIDKLYFRKGKLDLLETTAIKNVMVEFSLDLRDGGISRGLYEYLSPHMKDLTKEEFYQKYQHLLDYLLRILKKEIASRLED